MPRRVGVNPADEGMGGPNIIGNFQPDEESNSDMESVNDPLNAPFGSSARAQRPAALRAQQSMAGRSISEQDEGSEEF